MSRMAVEPREPCSNGDGTMLKSDSEAVLRYRSGDYEVVMPGTYVRCVVTGARIPLEDLRYWSFERQEAYVDAEAAARRGRGAEADPVAARVTD
jgi:hypothetical protein